MSPAKSQNPDEESRQLRQIMAKAKPLLEQARKTLHAATEEEWLMGETPLEVQSAMDSAARFIAEALSLLKLTSNAAASVSKTPSPPGGPTRQQGQFLAFIREYMMRNEAGVAPSHAELQRFFNLTPPSVNSMLIRLEQRGFIRRVPGKARAIELRLNSDWIPPLNRPFTC